MSRALSPIRGGPRRLHLLALCSATVAALLAVVAPGILAGASDAPVITGIGPAYGPSTGGTSVVIVGKNFTSVTAVDFGTTSAAGFTVTTSNSITAVSPPGTGVVNVIVATGTGISKINSIDKFDYGPVINCGQFTTVGCALNPSFGPPAGGTIVAISGANFLGATAVDFGTTQLMAGTTYPPPSGQFYFQSGNELIANAPAGTGTVDVIVVTPGGTSPSSEDVEFSYGPVLSCPTGQTSDCPVSPLSGPPTGGTVVTITGGNFTGVTAVNFGTTALTSTTNDPPTSPGQFYFVSDTELLADSPPGIGIVNVVVTTPGGTTAIASDDQFDYGPVVSAVSPNTGPATGGTSVTITGSNLTGATAVLFGTRLATSVVIVSANEITATSPPGKVSSVPITVQTPGGSNPTSAAPLFGYGPVVARIKPSYGPNTGGTQVTILGLDFTKAVSAVDFGQTPATFFKVKSSTKLIASAPAGTGVVDVTVLSSSGGSSPVVPTDKFNYGPTVTSINPSHGKKTGGTSVTVNGTNFSGVSAVNFGGSPAEKFTLVSPSKITAVSPAGTGSVNVTVITPGGTSPITSSDTFTY